MQLYERYDFHAESNNRFCAFMTEYPYIKFFQPSPEKAPWHVQCVVTDAANPQYDVVVNFWPHVAKMQIDGHKVVQSWEYINGAFDNLLMNGVDDFNVVE